MIELVEFCVLCFVIGDIFWLIFIGFWTILTVSLRVLVSLYYMAERMNILSAFWFELRCENFLGLQHVKAGEGCC